MVDCEPSDIDEPSEEERGGVPGSELEVQVLDRDLAGNGRVNTGIGTTNSSGPKWQNDPDTHNQINLPHQQQNSCLSDSAVPISPVVPYNSVVSKLERRYRCDGWFFDDTSLVR